MADRFKRALGPAAAVGLLIGASALMVPDNDPHIRYAELDSRGYAVITASKRELRAEFKAVDVASPGSPPTTLAGFQVLSGDPTLRQL